MSARPDRTPLSRSFFDCPVLTVAPDLLGRTLVRRHAYVYFIYGMSRLSA